MVLRMVRIASEQDFRATFRPVDQEELELPADLTFPMLIRGTMAWVEPGGHRTFLVFEDPIKKLPFGIIFKRASGSVEVPAAMCDFCHSIRGGAAVGMMTANVNHKRRVGVTACKDLSCQAKLDSTVPGTNDMRETFRPDQKRKYLLERISAFATRNLFVNHFN